MVEYRAAVDHDRRLAGSFAVHEEPGAVDWDQAVLVVGRGEGARAETETGPPGGDRQDEEPHVTDHPRRVTSRGLPVRLLSPLRRHDLPLYPQEPDQLPVEDLRCLEVWIVPDVRNQHQLGVL